MSNSAKVVLGNCLSSAMVDLPRKRPKLRGVSTLERTYEHGSFSEIFQVYSMLFRNE